MSILENDGIFGFVADKMKRAGLFRLVAGRDQWTGCWCQLR